MKEPLGSVHNGQTPGTGTQPAWVIFEGPALGIYLCQKRMRERRIERVENYPYMGAKFTELEHAKNFIQAFIFSLLKK